MWPFLQKCSGFVLITFVMPHDPSGAYLGNASYRTAERHIVARDDRTVHQGVCELGRLGEVVLLVHWGFVLQAFGQKPFRRDTSDKCQ